MISKILTHYAALLDEYLSRFHHHPEGLATVGLTGSTKEETPNKVVISLVNLEKEVSGDRMYMQRNGNNFVGKGAPLMMNMHIMLAAVYENRRYAESLSVYPVNAEIQYGSGELHGGSGADVHNGSAQHLDDHGWTILPVCHLQSALPDHRFFFNRFG